MSNYKKIVVAYGDGIGPEIMEATLHVLKEAKARISIDVIEIGKIMYERGYSSGIPENAWGSIHTNKILLKAPITTPQGGGYKSLNVTMRKSLGLFANVRPCRCFHPFIESAHPDMNLAIIRENEEDIYAGIEYRQTRNMYESLKLISQTGSEKIIRYAFEYARKNNRRKVTCMSKDNIMKFSDGVFHKAFDEIAKEYPDIQNDHYIIDIGTARLASKPGKFDVIVTGNLYGDIISDVVAEISGSVGLAGSGNIGTEYAMFEAIHGSAPDIAGKNIANPSGLISAAIMMLTHLGQGDVASNIQNAWLKTIEDGMHTVDIYKDGKSKKKLGTAEFALEVINRLGQVPSHFEKANYPIVEEQKTTIKPIVIDTTSPKELVGIDVFIDFYSENGAAPIAEIVEKIDTGALGLKTISSMGLKLWPLDAGSNGKTVSDHWCLRFVPKAAEKKTTHQELNFVLDALAKAGIDFIKTENLYVYGDKLGFSLAQGE